MGKGCFFPSPPKTNVPLLCCFLLFRVVVLVVVTGPVGVLFVFNPLLLWDTSILVLTSEVPVPSLDCPLTVKR